MIESRPLVWRVVHNPQAFPCFIHGCQEPAEHLVKLTHGDAIVQVCLCNECQRKSVHTILQGLTDGSSTFDKSRN